MTVQPHLLAPKPVSLVSYLDRVSTHVVTMPQFRVASGHTLKPALIDACWWGTYIYG